MKKKHILKNSQTVKKNNSYFKLICKTPNWLISAILYGFSWNMFFDVNLSFIAWFAFIPLFISLENKNTFWSFYKPALFFSLVAYFIICNGFLLVPQKVLLVFAGALDELLMSSISFALFYPFKKKFGFDKSLIIFPFIIALWEWIYQWLDNTSGYLMLSHSQCQNIWIIQFIDIFGVWSIASWVMAFNVLLFFQFKKNQKKLFSFSFIKKISFICCIMILPPLIYMQIRYMQISKQPKQEINITLINTNFSLFASDTYNGYISKIERLTYITDSIDFELKNRGAKSDLYVWHEAAVDHGNDKMFYGFIDTAVTDWKTPLLVGMQMIPYDAPSNDRRRVNRATLIQRGISQIEYQYYDKVHLSPGYEKIPYLNFLSKIPFFPISINDSGYYKAAKHIQLIELKTQDGRKIKLGTPICVEQNYPAIWSDMAVAGAECFVQLSYEAWWPTKYFQKQMANITRLRCIETRRSVGRCSNGGITEFIDSYGSIKLQAETPEGSLTTQLSLNNEITFFSKYYWNYPVLCLLFIAFFCAFQLFFKMKT
ncbi:MAG: apolipoprotein N-acyltransferase [Bacteroidetes bacterium]|nr:apolipoprotein N-acyltransferase [Bacteroidota bacterium]